MNSLYLKLRTSSSQDKDSIHIQDIDSLKTTQQKIQHHINKLADLNQKFHKKQEQSFLITFIQVMEKMSLELIKAKKKYENIDWQLKKEEVCSKLEDQITFFKRDNSELRIQVNSLKMELGIVKQKNQELTNTVIALRNNLKSKSIDNHKKTRNNIGILSRSSMHQQEVSINQINSKATAKKIFFRPDKRAETNLSRRINHSSLKTKNLREPSYESTFFQCQLQKLWSKFKNEHPRDFSLVKPKMKDKMLQMFIQSQRVKSILKSFLIDFQRFE